MATSPCRHTPMGLHKIPRWAILKYMKGMILQTVVETPEFIKQAKECMDDETRNAFIDYIAKTPQAGDIISGTGGCAKSEMAEQLPQRQAQRRQNYLLLP